MTASLYSYICSINLSDHTAGITDGQRICRDILCHNASGSDHGAVADGHTGQDDHAAAQPAAVTDADWQGISAAEVLSGSGTPVRSQPVNQFYRMRRRIELHIGGDQNIVSDGYRIAVYECTVHVYGYIVSQMDISSIIADKRQANGYVRPDAAK